MAKGLSAIIATIMLLMITVALIGVFYVFSSGLVTSGTSAVGSAATATTERMLKTVAIAMASCSNTTSANNIINFTVQNVGTKDILAGELKVYVDGVENTATSPVLAATGLAPNAQTQVGVLITSYKKTRDMNVQGPSNTEQRFLTC